MTLFFRHRTRSGATLILTLGIVAIISILATTFLLTARLQKQTTVISRNRQAAQDALPIALTIAMRQIEESLSYPNYTDEQIQLSGNAGYYQRMAPINRWFSETYSRTNNIDDTITFQRDQVMTSPTVEGFPSVNLLTPEALSHIPPVLTNGLPLDASSPEPLRSGWIPSDILQEIIPDIGLEYKLQNKPARVAFAVFDCSGVIDANIFPKKPSQTKRQKKYYAQSDLTEILEDSDSEIRSFIESNNVDIAELENKEPFFHTSYDPNPNAFRFYSGSGPDILGNENFSYNQPLDLNKPGIYQAITALTSGNLAYNKFNINNITNILRNYNATSVERWYNDPALNLNWLLPVTALNLFCQNRYGSSENFTFSNPSGLSWSMANFIDENRIPEVSTFVNSDMATRVNYAVEDVPLINKVSIFKVMGPNDQPDGVDLGPKEGPDGVDLDYGYYELDPVVSNHYAVAVELWYPFTPAPPPVDSACYVGIYTNEEDVITSTNRPMSQSDTRRWFDWIYAETSNSVMQVLFESWGASYEEAVGTAYLINNPLWEIITQDEELWFTTNMTSHPYWPEADTNGNFSIDSSPIYQALYPDTFDMVETNESTGAISTNTYTYTVATNHWLTIAVGGETNQFTYGEYYDDSEYTMLFWENVETEAVTSNLLGAVIAGSGEVISMALSENIPLGIEYDDETGTPYMVYENVESNETYVTDISSLLLAPVSDNPLFKAYKGVYYTTEEFQVEPLYIPDDLQQSLDFLIGMLPTNNIDELERFLMLSPDELLDEDWDNLFDNFALNPGINRTLLPQMEEPSLGNMNEDDGINLYPDVNSDVIDFDDSMLDKNNFQGYYWTIFPKQTVNFMKVEERLVEGGTEGQTVVTTNYYELGATIPGSSKRNTIWLRPAVTVRAYDPDQVVLGSEGDDSDLTIDKIVDEALLTHGNDNNSVPVYGWTGVTNLYISEPRNNAYARNWHSFMETWETYSHTTNLNYGVKELPFIHLNGPLQSIGDLGHIYTPYTYNSSESSESAATGSSTLKQFVANEGSSAGDDSSYLTEDAPFDTINFSMPSGASLVDFYTIRPDKPARGLVQANTTLKPTLDIVLSNIPIGWTNSVNPQVQTLNSADPSHKWSELWREALTNDVYNTGWRCFAEMLPDLSTNWMHSEETVLDTSELHSMHNYKEDVLRGIIDKVSFRQNVYVIILAAQAVAPASSETNPNVLSEQRVAVTVIRDAYSGNWTISDWRKLTQ